MCVGQVVELAESVEQEPKALTLKSQALSIDSYAYGFWQSQAESISLEGSPETGVATRYSRAIH